MLEDKLPAKEKEEWAARMDTYEGSNYEKFKQFLHARRIITERMKAIGSQKTSQKARDGNEVCTKGHCLRKGHDAMDCPAKKDRPPTTGSATTGGSQATKLGPAQRRVDEELGAEVVEEDLKDEVATEEGEEDKLGSKPGCLQTLTTPTVPGRGLPETP